MCVGGGGYRSRLCFISISKPLDCQLSAAAFPPVGIQVTMWNVCGWHHPPRESLLESSGGELDFHIFPYSVFLWLHSCRDPPHMCVYVCVCVCVHGKDSRALPRRRSNVEYNFKFYHSAWSYAFYFLFLLAPDVMNNICKKCFAHKEDSLFALLPDWSIIHSSAHWLLNMKRARYWTASVTGPAERSWQTTVCRDL